MAQAVRKAKSQVAELAEAAGVRLGALSSIRLAQLNCGSDYGAEMVPQINMTSDKATNLDPHKIVVLTTVEVAYHLQP